MDSTAKRLNLEIVINQPAGRSGGLAALCYSILIFAYQLLFAPQLRHKKISRFSLTTALEGKCSKAKDNRTIRLNKELTAFHQEVLSNLNCIHGALLRMNRSIQAEGSFGGIKWNRSYTRAQRRGLDALILETALISCGFNLHKFHLKKLAKQLAA